MRPLPLLALLLPAAAFAQSLPATSHPKLPFTLSQETTAITAPLRPDGTVDYLAALNQKYSQGVTPDNNGFVLFLQVTGTGENVLSPKVKAATLALAGASEEPAGSIRWEGYPSYMQRTKHLSFDAARDDLTAAQRAPWRPEQHPDLADFLQRRQTLLDLASEAAHRPHFWRPTVAENGRCLFGTSLPYAGVFRDLANTFLARACLRASSGDFDGFLADIKSARQLARQVGGGPTIIERLVGIAVENQATAAFASVAAQGNLTEAQCQTASAALDQLGPVPTIVESMDIYQRWFVLDTIQWISLDQLASDNQQPKSHIDTASVDWDALFKEANAYFDDSIRVTHTTNIKLLNAASSAVVRPIDAMADEARKLPQDLTHTLGESREAYTHRIDVLVVSVLYPNFGKAEELCRRCAQQTDMTRLLLTTAQFKARTGTWPKSLNDLVPAYLKDLPKDIYSPDESAPLRYLLTPSGPRIYSVGENARDDAGIRQPPDQDDLAIGTP